MGGTITGGTTYAATYGGAMGDTARTPASLTINSWNTRYSDTNATMSGSVCHVESGIRPVAEQEAYAYAASEPQSRSEEKRLGEPGACGQLHEIVDVFGYPGHLGCCVLVKPTSHLGIGWGRDDHVPWHPGPLVGILLPNLLKLLFE